MSRNRRPLPLGLHYDRGFVSPADDAAIRGWLRTLHPLWEMRYPEGRPLPAGVEQRPLLRPVYWLGSWQFACLDYYRPPNGALNRAVVAEPYPPALSRLVQRIEQRILRVTPPADVPRGFALTTCLVNFYGSAGAEDRARVGAHRDFEPGPVASISLGERAMFQFVRPGGEVAQELWLDGGSLVVFSGKRFKNELLHQVQRVDRRTGAHIEVYTPGFDTRRVNLTFRFVPPEHVHPWHELPDTAKEDTRRYVVALAEHSEHWRHALQAGARAPAEG